MLLLLLFAHQVFARLLPEDSFAFPKYTVTYLNSLPLLKHTADRWLHDGLRGGEPEFLHQPWESLSTKGIESSDGLIVDHVCSESHIPDKIDSHYVAPIIGAY